MSHSPIVPLSPRPQVESGWLPPPRSSSFNRSEYRNIASPSPSHFLSSNFYGADVTSSWYVSFLAVNRTPFSRILLYRSILRPSTFYRFETLLKDFSSSVLCFFLLLLLFSPCHGSRCEKKRNEEGEKERKKEEGSKRRVEKRERFPLSWSESFFFFNFFSLRKGSNPRMCKWFYERAFRAVRNAFVSQTFIFALQNRSHVLVKNNYFYSLGKDVTEWMKSYVIMLPISLPVYVL